MVHFRGQALRHQLHQSQRLGSEGSEAQAEAPAFAPSVWRHFAIGDNANMSNHRRLLQLSQKRTENWFRTRFNYFVIYMMPSNIQNSTLFSQIHNFQSCMTVKPDYRPLLYVQGLTTSPTTTSSALMVLCTRAEAGTRNPPRLWVGIKT